MLSVNTRVWLMFHCHVACIQWVTVNGWVFFCWFLCRQIFAASTTHTHTHVYLLFLYDLSHFVIKTAWTISLCTLLTVTCCIGKQLVKKITVFVCGWDAMLSGSCSFAQLISAALHASNLPQWCLSFSFVNFLADIGCCAIVPCHVLADYSVMLMVATVSNLVVIVVVSLGQYTWNSPV